jgi:O-acetyl-ADP-ribose deacetylase (regulator of RNase III)
MPEISVVRGSLVEQDVQYIVNAANTMMRGGGGIDGLIHKLAGPKLLLELYKVAPNGCGTGEVVVTKPHDLKYKGIIHTPGPRWKGGANGEPELLANSYRNSLIAVHNLGGTSIGFCSISTGVYGYPIQLAAPIAIETVRSWIASTPATSIQKIVFAMHGDREYDVFRTAIER